MLVRKLELVLSLFYSVFNFFKKLIGSLTMNNSLRRKGKLNIWSNNYHGHAKKKVNPWRWIFFKETIVVQYSTSPKVSISMHDGEVLGIPLTSSILI